MNSLLDTIEKTRFESSAVFRERSTFVGQDPSPQTLVAPNPCAQGFQLDNLAVIHKQVYFSAIILDVPGKYFWIGGFKHRFFQTESLDDFCNHVGSPYLNILGDTLRFDHNHICSGIHKAFRL